MARPKEMDNPTRMDMRLPMSIIERTDRWRGQLPGVPTRSEALRRLIELGLKSVEAENQSGNGATA